MGLTIIEKELHPSQYLLRPSDLKVSQLYVHHTVSGSADSALAWWKKTVQRIATEYIIERSGVIIRAMPLGTWAYHLGLGIRSLERESIGVELVSWGPLVERSGRFYSRPGPGGVEVPESEVVELGWRGFTHWQDYTEAQMKSLEALLNWQCFLYDIPRTRQDIMDVSPAALRGEPGIWSHASVRPDKSDAAPLPSLLMCLDAVAGR